ncbi:MAG TPA: class I SAM-dependent DNA methyltransferase, partial [Candidatus Hydrogenedentes bacterium]|nr:class I SAM-dependent DNA methyltransferase [Candidatus Hydrogenedentota bacterium]
MTVTEFIAKWRKVDLKERSAAQEHFLDLCHVFDHPTPAEADPTGEKFCFEKGAAKHGGGDGFADVWKRGFFGWEYKGKHKDLSAAYDQLLRYRDALENPPLLVLCDLDRIVVRTNFTGTVSAVYDIPLEDFAASRNIEIVRAVFHDPEALRPGRTSIAVTQEAAARIGEIAASIRERGLDPAAVAHFLDRVVFCLFAEDARLLPDMVFSRIAEKSGGDPVRFSKTLGALFEAMATGGDFGLETIRHFNGSLFDDRAVPDLTADDLKRIGAAASLDWSAVDPSIFGTLFERGLDPAKRSQLGAHFTGREDIERVVDAVVMTPLRRDWEETRATIESLLTTGRKRPDAKAPDKPLSAAALKKARGEAESILHQFLTRLREVKILDPACGSGNFLYVALLRLKDLEREAAVTFPSEHGLNTYLPGVGPWQLYGIEINPYAHDLAQMTVWIGWLQWIRANGFGFPADPILRSLSGNIRLMNSILAPDGTEPEWPTVDFIVGNPPFLGGKMLRRELGDDYVDRIFTLWRDRVPLEADLCCYWFEKARAHIVAGKCKRAGLLATQGIRGGANREVLKRIKETGNIFWAESDRPWILDGANVHVSMVGFDDGEEKTLTLDGKVVTTINANLTATANVGQAARLKVNSGLGFMGTTKQGPFEIDEPLALEWLASPNPHSRPNSDVLVPWINGMAVSKRTASTWIIDFFEMTEMEAARYETPFAYVTEHVKKARDATPRSWYRAEWWQHYAQRPEMRKALDGLNCFIVTPRVAKHRLFSWQAAPTNPDCQLIVFARSDDYFFGVLHSRFHEVWALELGTQLETRPRYTPTTCFETFPFPEADPERDAAIAAAAKELNELREGWLNPPDWTRTETLEFPGTVGGPWDRYIAPATVEDRRDFKVGTVRYSRLVPRDAACAARLKERTLTKLYNVRPAWLADCHARLDAAVAAAYGWPA